MRKEEIVSSCIMILISGLVLIGFTIAWFTSRNTPIATGVEMEAVALGEVKVALTPGGVDVTELPETEKYAEIGVEKFSNVDEGELAPGTYGKVTFYVMPINSAVRACNIVPTVRITQDGNNWYPTEEEDAALQELYDIVQGHIHFFSDEEMTNRVTVDEPFQLIWTAADSGQEKTAVVYWKWHYEYPFTAEENASFSDEEKKERLEAYDLEDMRLGNNISGIKYFFTFSAQ